MFNGQVNGSGSDSCYSGNNVEPVDECNGCLQRNYASPHLLLHLGSSAKAWLKLRGSSSKWRLLLADLAKIRRKMNLCILKTIFFVVAEKRIYLMWGRLILLYQRSEEKKNWEERCIRSSWEDSNLENISRELQLSQENA